MAGDLMLFAFLICCLAFVGWISYIAGRNRGWDDNEESRVTPAQHNRGIRGFDRPVPRTSTTEAKIHEADWRNKSEGFDM